MDDTPTRKTELRRTALSRRDAMDMAGRAEASHAAGSRLLAFLDVDRGTVVSAFLPIRSEIDLRPLFADLAERGALICVPAIVEGTLQFRHLAEGVPLVPQGFGTVAPGADADVLDPSVMLVPLAAFDRRGGRIGYGKGHYDRAVAALRAKGLEPRLIGTAFSCQEVDEVPTEEHDVRLHAIVTEREAVEVSAATAG